MLDLKELEIFELPGEPKVLDQQYIFGESGYYGDHDFKIYDTQTKDSLVFSVGDISLKEVSVEEGIMRFEAKSSPPCKGDDYSTSRYYKVDLKSGL